MKTSEIKEIPYIRLLHGNRNAFLYDLLSSTRGRVFSVTFKKKDGSIRTVNGRRFIEGSVNGNGQSRPFAFIDNNVYLDLIRQGYPKELAAVKSWRSFVPENVLSFQIGGEKYKFQPAGQ